MQESATIDDKVLITIYESKSAMQLIQSGEKSFYVPLEANVHYLRTFITGKYSSSKDSIFLFAYGNILNNHETMRALRDRFQGRVKESKGIEIQIAAMASF